MENLYNEIKTNIEKTVKENPKLIKIMDPKNNKRVKEMLANDYTLDESYTYELCLMALALYYVCM